MSEVAVLFVYVLSLTNAGFMLCLFLLLPSRLQVLLYPGTFEYVLCLENIGFVQGSQLNLHAPSLFRHVFERVLCLTNIGFVPCTFIMFCTFSDAFVEFVLHGKCRGCAALFLWLGIIAIRLFFFWSVVFNK